MLPKKYRLAKEKDFKKVHQRGKFFGEKFLAAKILKTKLPVSRFGFLVGVKISKKATVRNKVKRRLRESVRLKLDQIKPGFDVAIIVKPEIVDKNYKEIDEAVKRILEKAKLFY